MVALASALPASAQSIFASLPEALWHDDRNETRRAKPIPSGYRALDQELPNGCWPSSVLIELLMPRPDVGELLVLAPALRQLTQAGKTVILLAPPHIPSAASLADLGIDLSNVILIKADKPMDRIWAVEQAMQSVDFGALLCWLPEARPDHLRRLQLLAASNDGLTFVFRPLSDQSQSSPAPLRMLCQPATDGRMSVEIIKRRGPVHSKPMMLPLAASSKVSTPAAARSLSSPVFTTPSYTVAHSALAATAARHRATLPV
ncbi:translesion DNA synthesis-associated protein ImuA [Herminiimonas arsenitoxidans]|uniref:translesion DNA synthesis-associated protein ImuA n=1 Tax=Herminiimonas arsenitoxidans TaxID=1809410 RepID=UPI000970C848|nr:translesion DNA synthesis-associated protein ImuA [Herminiimonas arsenitoxidans]